VMLAIPLTSTEFSTLRRFRTGKVRDVYDLGDSLLIVATDRISAFDYVLGSGIPDKGKVLTQLSVFWFAELAGVVPNHFITTDVAKYPAEVQAYAADLAGRSMLVRKTAPIDVECVARGYLAGSGWKEYQQTGRVCGIPLPGGLVESGRLPAPIFTPATKASTGHDVQEMRNLRPAEVGVQRQTRAGPEQRLVARRAEALTRRRRDPALPHDRVGDREPGRAIPDDGRLALVGDADRGDARRTADLPNDALRDVELR